MCYVFGICSIGAIVCIYGDFCYKAGGRANTKSARLANTVTTGCNFGAVIGLVPTVINYIYVILLWFSKLRVIKTDFFPWYKTLTFYFAPLIYLVAPNSFFYSDEGRIETLIPPASEISVGAMLLFTVLPLIFELTCWAAYYVGYNHISLKEKLLYGERSNRSKE